MLLVSQKHAWLDIVLAGDAAPAVRYAAEELQRYVWSMTLGYTPILEPAAARHSNRQAPQQASIYLGDFTDRRQLFPRSAARALEGEQYVIQTEGRNVLVLGGSPRGTLYGVYDLLERFGVRWWAPDGETVPVRPTLALPELNVRVEPPLIYRATWYRHAMDADWQARVRLDAGTMGPVLMSERHGGMERFAADASGHTYQGLVPTDTYFDEHPEYFSEVGGKRLRHMNQLCPTHPDVARIAAENARQWLDRTPGCRIVSVTQNDHGNWCTCSTCAPMLERTGAPSGPMLYLANEVARHLESTHPHVLVDTFAYAWSERPPQNIEAHPNVLIRLAPIGNCFGHPIRSCPHNEGCRKALEAWSKIAQHLFVWHYVTDFFHYLMPFPNLPPLADDMRTYLDHGVKGVFMQGAGTSLGGDMPELKAYLIARLMWDPSVDANAVRAEFLEGYYRTAAEGVQRYLRVFEDSFAKAGKEAHLHLYRSLWKNDAKYLEPRVIDKARTALSGARQDANDDPQVQARLDRIEAGLDYTELFYHDRPGARKLRKLVGKARGSVMSCPVSPRRKKLALRFFTVMARNRVTHYAEDLGRYTRVEELRRAWLDSIGDHEQRVLEGGGSRAVVVPALGGRIVSFGPSDRKLNVLGESSPDTFGYPCAGGYEEYTLQNHQSPGFSQRFEVQSAKKGQLALRATIDTGLIIDRQLRLDAKTGELQVSTALRNPFDIEQPACLRAHLEINLGAPPPQWKLWLLRGRQWESLGLSADRPYVSLYEQQVPDGWLFWEPSASRGLWQRWSRAHAKGAVSVGAAFLGTVPAEPNTLALDLCHGRYNEPIATGAAQKITHRLRWIDQLPEELMTQA